MFLHSIQLRNFRNYHEAKFDFNQQLTIVIGPNARGKTNILEAIFFILNGSGFRETKEDELLHFKENVAAVNGRFCIDADTIDLQIVLRKVNERIEKIFTINKVQRRSFQYQKETSRSVLFSPDQIIIITGSPEKRRSYFDRVLSFYDLEYKKRLSNYEQGLRKRNKVLEFYRNEDTLKEELSFWNTYLLQQSQYVAFKRSEYIDYLNSHNSINDKMFYIEYIKNEFSYRRLEEVYEDEKRYRRTIVGPQKDDFNIYTVSTEDKHSIHHFGSRSEQRLGIFWLHFTELKYCEEKLKKRPIILLDDIFSELDMHNKKLIIDLITQYQTILTTTEEEIVELANIKKSIIRL